MKLKSKILLGAFGAVALAAIPTTIALTATSCGTSSVSSSTPKTETPVSVGSSSVNSPIAMENSQFEKMAAFSLKAVDSNVYQLTIKNKDSTKGTVTFADGSMVKNFQVGDKIVINVNATDPAYTVGTVKVHAASNVDKDGIGNWTLGVDQLSETQYTFQLPEKTNALGEPNKFYDETQELSVDVTWTPKKFNDWTYDWINGTDAGVYMLKLTSDLEFDDVAHPNLKMQAPEGSNNTIYRIYMNGFNLSIKNMTIPSGVQLMFINNKENTFDTKAPVVSIAQGSSFKEASVKGGIGRWGSVEFSDELNTILNLNVYRGWGIN